MNRQSYKDLIRRAGEGKQLTLRLVHSLRDGLGNAPAALQAVGSHLAGVSILTLDLAGKRLTGGLLAGGTLLIGATPYTLAASALVPAPPAAPQLAVSISPPLAAPLADNATVTIGAPHSDYVVYRARATGNAAEDEPKNTSDGRSHFVIPAHGLPIVPAAGMQVILDGETLTVHDVRPRGPAEILGYVLAVGSTKGAA